MSTAILYYDYLLTFGDEVRFFWRRKKTNCFTILFFLNRYVQLVGNVGIAMQEFSDVSEKVSTTASVNLRSCSCGISALSTIFRGMNSIFLSFCFAIQIDISSISVAAHLWHITLILPWWRKWLLGVSFALLCHFGSQFDRIFKLF